MISAILALALTTCPPELFRIEKDTNLNTVVYSADGDKIKVEWIMLAEDGHRELPTGLEWSLGLGFDQHGDVIIPYAQRERILYLRIRNGCPVIITEISGRRAYLTRVYVHTGFLPIIVTKVDLIGNDTLTGELVIEKLNPPCQE